MENFYSCIFIFQINIFTIIPPFSKSLYLFDYSTFLYVLINRALRIYPLFRTHVLSVALNCFLLHLISILLKDIYYYRNRLSRDPSFITLSSFFDKHDKNFNSLPMQKRDFSGKLHPNLNS